MACWFITGCSTGIGREIASAALEAGHSVAVTAYSPFGHDGFPAAGSPGGQLLAEIASAHGASPRQVALAFLTRRPSVFAIPKAGTQAHVEDNAGALRLRLTEGDLARIDAAFPLGRKPSSLPML